MGTKIKYCVWDVGNTIYRYSLAPLENEMLRLSIDFNKYRENKKGKLNFDAYMKGEIDFDAMCKIICDYFAVPFPFNTIDLRPIIAQALKDGIGDDYDSTITVMKNITRTKAENCILSNALPILAGERKLGNLVAPEHIFTSYELGLLKPDPKIFEAVRAKLGCEFNEMVFVDDKPKNVQSAKELGIDAILFNQDRIGSEIGYRIW